VGRELASFSANCATLSLNQILVNLGSSDEIASWPASLINCRPAATSGLSRPGIGP
jgi:hypothetical protein